MRRLRFVSRAFAPVALSLTSSFAPLGCSFAGDAEGSHSGAASVPSEAGRVQAYIDSLYEASSVRHSFKSAMGDTIDCTDFASEPGVRALLANGVSMSDVEATIEDGERAVPSKGEEGTSLANFEGDRDDDGNVRACPSRTVPHVRVTAEEIASKGGLDRYLAPYAKTAPTRESPLLSPHDEAITPDAGGYQSDTGYYAWVMNDFSPARTLVLQGGTSTMTIAAPSLTSTSGGHSVAQVWLTGGDRPGQTRQTIEAGWIATPGATTGAQPPHLFIFSTADAYAHYCFNGGSASTCVPWVPNPSATLALGATLPASSIGGTQHELAITITHQWAMHIVCTIGGACVDEPIYTGWGIYAQVDSGAQTYLGYYANSGFANVTTPGLATSGDDFEMGGEVYDLNEQWTSPPGVQMGEGALLAGGAAYGSTAYHRNFSYMKEVPPFVGTQTLTGSVVDYTNSEYIYNITAAPGASSWTDYFYFGDYTPLHIIPVKLD